VLAAPAVSCARDGGRGAHEHTGTAGALRHSPRNGFTAYAELSPETNSFCLRHRRIDGVGKPGRASYASADLTPATGARTTWFCRTLQCRSSAAPPVRSRAKARPAIRLKRSGRCRVHRIPTHVRDDRDTPLLAGRNGRGCRADLGAGRRSIFLKRGLDGANHFDRAQEFRLIAHRPARLGSPPIIVHRKNALGQPGCIFRLGGPCSLIRNSAWFAGAKA
jgi:hypothetical protein